MPSTNISDMPSVQTLDVTVLGERECGVRAIEGFESKKVLTGFVGAAVLTALAGCVPLAKELRDPAVRASLAGVLLAGAAAFFLHALYLRGRIGKRITVYERGLVSV